ncbi:hypothetical protein [Pseudodesulfovibrio sp.]|uniref:hypothetical protein n=1 Tax=unclassified Pseudodesulfovibrio TaxID=2661612 RepID=UPI003B005F69
MKITSVSGMQMGFNLGRIRQNTSEGSDDFATEMSAKFLEDNNSDRSLSQEELLSDAKANIAEMQANFENKVPGDTTSLSSMVDDGTQISALASGQQNSGKARKERAAGVPAAPQTRLTPTTTALSRRRNCWPIFSPP